MPTRMTDVAAVVEPHGSPWRSALPAGLTEQQDRGVRARAIARQPVTSCIAGPEPIRPGIEACSSRPRRKQLGSWFGLRRARPRSAKLACDRSQHLPGACQGSRLDCSDRWRRISLDVSRTPLPTLSQRFDGRRSRGCVERLVDQGLAAFAIGEDCHRLLGQLGLEQGLAIDWRGGGIPRGRSNRRSTSCLGRPLESLRCFQPVDRPARTRPTCRATTSWEWGEKTRLPACAWPRKAGQLSSRAAADGEPGGPVVVAKLLEKEVDRRPLKPQVDRANS